MTPKPDSAIFSFDGGAITVAFEFVKRRPGKATVTIGEKSKEFPNTKGDYKARVTDSLHLIELATTPEPKPVETHKPTVSTKRKSRRKMLTGLRVFE